MIKKLIATILLLAASAFSQQGSQLGSGGSGSSTATNVYPGASIVTSGLMAQYRILPTETAAALVDYSGNGNNATGTVGTAPTIISGTGGLNFTGNGAVSIPAALNSAQSVMLYISYQYSSNANRINALVAGNGAGGNSAGAILLLHSGNSADTFLNPNPGQGGAWPGSYSGGGLWMMQSRSTFDGVGTIGWTMNSSDALSGDRIYVNGNDLILGVSASIGYFFLRANSSSAGTTTTGNYQLGGAASNNGNNFAIQTWLTGKIYYALFYNRVLTPQEMAQNHLAMVNEMTARGVPLSSGATDQNSQLVVDGDSISVVNGLSSTGWATVLTLNGAQTWNIQNVARTGAKMDDLAQENSQVVDPVYHAGAERNAVTIWAGTNDGPNTALIAANVVGNMRKYCTQRRAVGWKCIVASIISRSGSDTYKNTFNPELRAQWATLADGFADVGADPNLGADGQSANTTYFQGDAIHPSQFSIYNIIAPIMERAVNYAFGNRDWNSATTYTTTAPAATSITAASESTNTVTITSALNPPVGSRVTIASVTPSGYNGTYMVLTTSAGSFTYYNVSGLGAGSAFGTASVPLMKDADVYANLGGSATTPSYTLQSCIGLTGQNLYLKNSNTTSAWVITPFGSETIDGAATLTMPTATSGNNPVVILQAVASAQSTGGCNWKRVQ